MENKCNKTLENVLILADEEIIEICSKKSYYDKCLARIPQENITRRNLRKLLSECKKRHRFGLTTNQKHPRKKTRHYMMKLVNFNTILLHDQSNNEYFVVFYRSGLSFNTNIANIYFTGAANKSRRRRTPRKRVSPKLRSFENYLRREIKHHYIRCLDGKHNLISVHAIFSVDNPNKSKVFLTRDITKFSDIKKFIRMIDSFDPTLKHNVNNKIEKCLQKFGIPMRSVLVVAQLNQSCKNLFLQWSDNLIQSFPRKNVKNRPATRLINTNLLELRLDHIRFNGTDCTKVKYFMDIVQKFVSRKSQDENIEKKLETQLDSCKKFIACLDAFQTEKMTDVPPEADVEASPKSETSDDRVKGIMSKIETLQKRIQSYVKKPDVWKPEDETNKVDEVLTKQPETPKISTLNVEKEGGESLAAIEQQKAKELLKILQKNTNNNEFGTMIKQMKDQYQKKKNEALVETKSLSSRAKQPPVSRNVKQRPRSKQKKPKTPENIVVTTSATAIQKPPETNVIKLDNFVDQILNITKTYFAHGTQTETKTKEPPDERKSSEIVTIKKYSKMNETTSQMSTDTINSLVRKMKMAERAAQTSRMKRRRLVAKVTQTDVDVAAKQSITMETQTDISIHKHAQIKFSGINMQLSKNVTITNVRKNVINVRNICEETTEAVKRLLEKEKEDRPMIEDKQYGNNKAEILTQIKSTLENVIDRFKKSTLLISKASNFADMTDNFNKLMTPTPATPKENITKSSKLAMSLKLLKNLSEVTKTIRRNPREAAKRLHGIRNELMQYRKHGASPAFSQSLQPLRKESSLIFPKDTPLNVYGYPASNTDLKPKFNELNRIFTPKTRSICNTELSIMKHRDRHADHIASHLSPHQITRNLKMLRNRSSQVRAQKCQMYIAKTYKKSYETTMSQTATNVPQIQTAIENPLVPKIVRPVRWKHPLPDSPQLSNLCLNDVKPFNAEYPRKDRVSPAAIDTHLERLLEQGPLITCTSGGACPACSPEVSDCGAKCPKQSTGLIVNKGKAHFKTEHPKNVKMQPLKNFDFGRYMWDPENPSKHPEVCYTVYPVFIQHTGNLPELPNALNSLNALNPPKTSKNPKTPKLNKRFCEVKNNQTKMQKTIQQAIIQNQEKFQAMQRILALSKPQERKMAHPPSNKNSAAPKIKSSYGKKFVKDQKPTIYPQPSHSVQTAVAAYKSVQPHPKLKQLQQHQIPLKPKPVAKPPPADVAQNVSGSFNKKYSEISLPSMQTIVSKDPSNGPKNNVKHSQEDIQKYIALVEQKFLKTFSLDDHEKEGAYKNLVDEIQGMLNVLNNKEKTEKKIKATPVAVKKNPPEPEKKAEVTKYTEKLESVEKTLKDFQNNCEENYKISEAATEKLLNWKKTIKSAHEDISKTNESSKTSLQYTLSEKERIIDEKVIKIPQTATKTTAQPSEVKDVSNKKKNPNFTRPTLPSTTVISSDSLTETDENVTSNSFKLNPPKRIRESPNSTDTSLIPTENTENTENSFLTITEYSATGSSASDVNIAALVEFSVEMYFRDHLHYSHRCQSTVTSIIPRIYHEIQQSETINAKPITRAFKQKYNYNNLNYDYSVSSNLNFSDVTDDSYHIEQEFIKNYSDKVFTESINTILNKNSEFSLKNILGESSTKQLSRKSSTNFYDYIDLLSNISRMFIEPEVTQFYQPKFVACNTTPERQTITYNIIIVLCCVEYDYVAYDPSTCNLLDLEVIQDTTSHLSVTENTVSEMSDLTATQNSNTTVSTVDMITDIAPITKYEFFNDDLEIQTTRADEISTKPSVEKIPPNNPREITETVSYLSNKLALQSNELNQLVESNQLQRLPRLVTVKNAFFNHFECNYNCSFDCNYDLKLTISPKYLTNLTNAMCILPLLKDRITMKIELNHFKGARGTFKSISFKKPKRNFTNSNNHNKFSLVQPQTQPEVRKQEVCTESHKMILILLYVSLFSFIFVCMTLNYKCE